MAANLRIPGEWKKLTSRTQKAINGLPKTATQAQALQIEPELEAAITNIAEKTDEIVERLLPEKREEIMADFLAAEAIAAQAIQRSKTHE
jgi:TRAP-type C4-dicarboxylate transport system substrate-binding protein